MPLIFFVYLSKGTIRTKYLIKEFILGACNICTIILQILKLGFNWFTILSVIFRANFTCFAFMYSCKRTIWATHLNTLIQYTCKINTLTHLDTNLFYISNTIMITYFPYLFSSVYPYKSSFEFEHIKILALSKHCSI